MSKQPNSRHCFVCGLENPSGLKMTFYSLKEGEVQAECTVPEPFQGYPGVVHGGVVASMLDEVTGRAHWGENNPQFMVTAQLNVRYRKPVPVGQPLRLAGQAGIREGRVARATGQIFNQDGVLLAEADAVMVDIPDHMKPDIDPQTLGWQIYPDEEVQ